MRKVWIEAALNGSWGRALQPGIPDTVETIIAEGVACARAGATIVHVHAYDGGPQTYDWQVYARIIEGIRNQVDVPVYPSYPAFITTGSDSSSLADVAARFADIEELAARGLLDFAVVDPGSVNLSLTKITAATQPGGTYMNPEIPDPVCARSRRTPRPAYRFCHLRARLRACRRSACARGRRQGADLSSHVL